VGHGDLFDGTREAVLKVIGLLDTGGGYDLVSTSSLGITGGAGVPGGSVAQLQFNNYGTFGGSADFTISTSTGEMSVTGGLFSRATVTNATTTALFSTFARFTTAVADSFSSTLAVIGGATITNSTTTNATTTRLYASSATFDAATTTNLRASNASIGSLSGPLQAVNGVVSATSSISIAFGGTGTSTAPTYGQVLLGNAVGGYDLVATSSLGITSAAWGNITGTLSNQTDLQNALNAKLSLTDWYSTTTSDIAEGSNLYFTTDRVATVIAGTTTTALAEGTNLYFTTARATTSFVSNLAATTSVASITTLPNLSLAATQLSGFGIPFFQYFAATTTDALTQGTTNKYYSSALFAADLAATTSVNSIIALNNLVITAAQVSDFANGINAYIAASTTIPKTYTSNTFAGTQTFQNASTTNISATYASSTNLVTGNATTTNLAVASLSNSLLKVNALGQVGAASVGVDFVAPGSLSNYLLLADWYSTTTSDIQEGSNLYFTTARATTSFVSNLAATTSVASITTLSNLSITNAQVSDFASGVNTFVGSSSTLPKTYAANAFTALQQFAAGASSTAQSALDYVAVGRTATTTIRGEANATSTFAGGVEAGALNVISTVASSTFANGINLAQGCFAVNGTCIGAGGGGGSGVIVNIQAFTSSGTYTPSPGATSAQVIVTGAGGGGGGILGTDTTNETVAGGGGAGATSIDYVDLTNVTTVSVTVGAGGTAGAATGGTGGTGGTSSFGSFAAADGGVGGVGSAVNATGCAATGAIGAGGAGGSASLGAINIPGGAGSVGSCLAEITNGGDGAASYWGGGGSGAVDTNGNGAVVGNSAVVYGAGGGGAAEEDATTGATGGAGAGGIVVVYEYGPHTGVTAVDDGGTGTSTAPAYGQVLVGNALGGYDLVATSSLGITSGSSFDYLFPGNATTTKIDFNGGLSASYASTTGISSGYASSTQGFFGSLSVGSLSGVLRATAGVISTGLVNLASEVSGVLGVANGGTGWANIQANTLLTGNGAGAVATTSIGSSLQLSGGTLSLNLSNPNVWNGLQTFSNSSTTIISAYRAYFGGTATTTIDGAGNVVVGGSLTSTAGDTTLASTSATRIAAAYATTTNATSTNAYADSLVAAGATSTRLYVSSSFMGAGLTTCSASGDKLLWNSATGQFTCGVDAGGVGSGVTSLGAAGQGQTGATQTFATSSDTNIGLTITSLANTHTFTTIWNGILSVARGGTGWGNIQAGTLLTGNGTGALATTTIGSSLQISGSTLSLNLANANIWTGLQTFNTASTTLLETVTQWARTIQSTSTNALALRTNLTATAGLTLGSTSTPQMLALDTVNNRTTIGTGGGTPTLFVIDTKNTAGDPSGVDGASYYNSNSGLWRCYAGGTWRTCGGQAASSTGAVQLSGSDGGLGGTANFAWSFLTNGLTIKATSSAQTTDLLTFASTTGNAMFAVSSRGVLELATTTDPSAAASGQLNIYAKDVAGRVLPKWVGPSGVDTPFQPAFFGNNVSMWFPNTGATVSVAMGTSWTARNSGTAAAQTTPAIASTNLYTSMKRGLFSTGTTATGSSGTQSSQTLVWRGNAAGLGGFFYFARVGVDSTYRTDVQMMNGVSALNAALTGQPSAQNNSIILGKDSGDTTWQIITRDGATANKVDTGLTIASGQILDFYIFARPQDHC
jgi:hypothetical protein